MRIYIAEDEPLAARKLQLFLEKLGEHADDLTLFSDGLSLVDALSHKPYPDLIFLDIQMPGLTGLEVLKKLQEEGNSQLPFNVIITSAYDQYAIDGFNFGVADYLLKPYTIERLRQALYKVRPEPTLNIRVEGRTERVRICDIVCLEALKDYTCLTMIDGRRLQTLGTLLSFEQQLPPTEFVRVQRSYILALRHVISYNNQSVILTTDLEIPIGKTYRESFSEAMNK